MHRFLKRRPFRRTLGSRGGLSLGLSLGGLALPLWGVLGSGEPAFAGVRVSEAPAALEAAPEESPVEAPTSPAASEDVSHVRASVAGLELDVAQFELDNGLRVYVVEDHSTPAFAMHTAFRVGSRDEEPGRTGFAHFFEHMMFKGSKNVPDGGLIKYVMSAGGQLNAFTTEDVTQYFVELPSNYLDMALWLESDRLASLEINAENFENQRAAVQEERALRLENSPYTEALFQFLADVWAGSGYGHPPIGSTEDLEAAQVTDMQAFFDKYYRPNNAVVVISGDVTVETVRDKVRHYYGGLARGPELPQRPGVDHSQTTLSRKAEDAFASQPLYVMGWKTVPESHPDRAPLDLLMGVLFHGRSSRVTRVLVDEKKLALTVFNPPSFSGGYDAGAEMVGVIPVGTTGIDAIWAVVWEEIEALKKDGVSDKLLRKAINQRTVETVRAMATNNSRALQIAHGAVLSGDPTRVVAELEAYLGVTSDDLVRVATTYLTDKTLRLEVVPKQ